VKRTSRIYVAGGDTLLGVALRERLRAGGFQRLVGEPPGELDLSCPRQVEEFFAAERPEYVFLVAGPSGGIRANQNYPARLMRDNLLATTHVVHAAHRHGVAKLLYLASSCSYPRLAPQPMRVESLMTGPLEPTNEAYAMAKLAGLVLCQAYRRQYAAPFITAIPANAFGPHDDFSAEDSHVIPGLLRKFHEARCRGQAEVRIWGSGRPRREFIYSRDLADACLFVMRNYDADEPINLGGGQELSIAETASAVAAVVGYRGRLSFDTSRPDGMPLKGLDSGPLRRLGWTPPTDFPTALAETYDWFLRHVKSSEFRVLSSEEDSSGLSTQNSELRTQENMDVRKAVQVSLSDTPAGRRAGSRLPDGQDQKSHPSVDRPGSGLGRRLRGAAAR
jgi:GDP-L-fucose synthase